MFKYCKKLVYPINLTKKDLKMAKNIITQFGGPNGELGAALRYFSQSFGMPTKEGKDLLSSIAAEEFSHAEMIATIVHQLMKGATIGEIKEYGLDGMYVEHGYGIYPTDSNGVPFSVSVFNSVGDVLADLEEDMAAEEKARVTYEHLIDLATDPELINILLFLRQREIVHYARFKELREYYKKMYKN